MVSHIRLLIVQGILLFLISISSTEHTNWLNIAFLTVETLIVKSIVIPWFLFKVLKKTHIKRDVAPNIPHFYCLVTASVIMLAGFLAANYWISSVKMISPIYFGVSVATIIISLWLITIKHTIISNVIEFITMENGIFLLSLSVAKEMPILGLFVNVIDKEFKDLEVSHLSELKDYDYND